MDKVDGDRDIIAKAICLQIEVAVLKRRRRLLLEELFRQYIEGEVEPRKRRKPRNQSSDDKRVEEGTAQKAMSEKSDDD